MLSKSKIMNLCYTKNLMLKISFTFSAENKQGINDWSAGYNSYTDYSDVNSIQVCICRLIFQLL